ncbi:hypothetical protein ACTTAI_08295 [Rhodobacter capsulatus]|uniref:hypothetical protein n=1 Tax=Rhodobacter capsulatus TaxID=1061 RepID=UPI004025E1FF
MNPSPVFFPVPGRAALAAAVLAIGTASMAAPVCAQDGTGTPPEHAQKSSYGSGWDCEIGYRLQEGACLAIPLPDHAYATGRSYGTGWACLRGFEEVARARCEPIAIPEHAFLQSSGYGWQCERGYRKEREACVEITLPEHAYLVDDATGPGWACERGFKAEKNACLPIVVPENGYLTNSAYGPDWACERGVCRDSGALRGGHRSRKRRS